MDLFLALEIIALALSGLLIWHSARTRGADFTCMFFIGGAFLGLVRENVVAQVAVLNLYSYNPATGWARRPSSSWSSGRTLFTWR
jgi:hypothetical protein